MNNQARGNSRRGRFRRGRGQYLRGNMGHPQNGGVPGQAPVPFPPPPPPPVVAYPAYGQVPYAMPPQPYIYPLHASVVNQNAAPPGYYPYANPVPTYIPPPPQGQVNQAAQGQAHMAQLTQGEGNHPAQVPGQYHGPRLRRHHRSRVQARGRGNDRGNRGQPNRRQLGRDNCSPRPQRLESLSDAFAHLVTLLNSGADLPDSIQLSSDLDSRGVKQEDTEDESTLVAQNLGSTEIKREPVIKQEPQ
ncbi:hypothetical protein FPCIR_10299 [Fusarium pseudocircinatum]|uniref:Uncharacterized protein n=1 Tax=Fusarium pseudocircinatum TaxID=56676 RepID=A0A8H5NWS8_9HYPO|nr:hypothetical protein FPCIR_10299 [Fusarium pseudocircinatum]